MFFFPQPCTAINWSILANKKIYLLKNHSLINVSLLTCLMRHLSEDCCRSSPCQGCKMWLLAIWAAPKLVAVVGFGELIHFFKVRLFGSTSIAPENSRNCSHLQFGVFQQMSTAFLLKWLSTLHFLLLANSLPHIKHTSRPASFRFTLG